MQTVVSNALNPTPVEEFDYEMLNRELDRTKSKVFLGSNAAFLGPLMCSLEFVWTTAIDTAATDGTKIEWNPHDFLGCTPEGRVSSLLHELAHVYRLHPVRRGDRCPDIWNLACDIVINRDLIKLGYGIDGWHKAGIGPHPEIPFELEEDIYDYLKKPGAPPMPSPSQCGCSGMPQVGPAGQQAMINAVVQAAHAATISGQAGQIPGNVTEVIKNFLAPKVPWESLVHQWMTELLDEDYTWARPNRRYRPMYLPSRFTDEGRLCHLICYQDVSGSISSKDSLRFNSELKFIWDTYKPEKLTIVQFDRIIQKIDLLEEGDSFTEIEIIGRGGTSLVCVRDHIMQEKPTAAIIFSDLQVTPMEPGPECPVLWVAVSNKAAQVKFGKLIHIRP
jgi:predicted metal-dependent peptidase